MSFIRRYTSFPPKETIMLIEGVVIVDATPLGSPQGVGTGTVGMVGEFADMTYAVTVDANGNVTTNPQAVEVFSAQDQVDKLGGFDETIGNFGTANGNGYVELKSRLYSRLICVPVNLCSSMGMRMWRELPTNKAATDPTPVFAVQAASVAAGREFRNGNNRVRVGKKMTFFDDNTIGTGVDGDTAVAAAAAVQNFVAVSGNFVLRNVKKGDILVVGVIGGVGYLGSNAGTFRVTAITNATTLVVEKMDGTNFAWIDEAAAAQPWRLYPARVADIGGNTQLSEVAGCQVPVRPLDATINQALLCTPTVAVAAGSATFWDPLSGLTMRTPPAAAVTYTAGVQAPNAVNASAIDVLYDVAVDAFKDEADPAPDVQLIFSARKSDTIRSKLRAHVLEMSQIGRGRRAFVSPQLTTVSLATVLADAAPGVGATRAERINYNWPGVQVFVREAVSYPLLGADGKTHDDGFVDVTFDSFNASLQSILPPERNPGQLAPPVDVIMAGITGRQRLHPKLGIGEYSALRRAGVAAPKYEKSRGHFVIQSGITSSLTSGEKDQNRRAMADYIEDSLAVILGPFSKLPQTQNLIDGERSQCEEWLGSLIEPSQRIDSYLVDMQSGMTDDFRNAGIQVIIVKVRTVPTADFIVIQCEVGNGVVTTSTVNA